MRGYSELGGVRRRLVELRVERVLLAAGVDRVLRRPVDPAVLVVLRRRRVVVAPETALCTRR
jgi:hypothetical protein